MKKITAEASKAFWDGVKFNRDNTNIIPQFEGAKMSLHGNNIASYSHYDGKLFISSRGWFTNTTKERLNGILSKIGLKIYQKKGVWYVTDYTKSKESDFKFVDGMEIML